jgi:hypothetical protein
MRFLQTWLTGYYSPAQLIERLKSGPAPQWGLLAQLIRGLLDSFLIYLPVALMGRVPPTPSNLSFIPTERYYYALVWLAPIALFAILLMQSAVIHVLLRLMNRPSDIDQIINITGMAALVVGAFLVPWDWAVFALGVADQYVLGISHIIISLWAIVIIVVGLRRILSVPIGLSIALSFLIFPIALPFSMMFMRSPF